MTKNNDETPQKDTETNTKETSFPYGYSIENIKKVAASTDGQTALLAYRNPDGNGYIGEALKADKSVIDASKWALKNIYISRFFLVVFSLMLVINVPVLVMYSIANAMYGGSFFIMTMVSSVTFASFLSLRSVMKSSPIEKSDGERLYARIDDYPESLNVISVKLSKEDFTRLEHEHNINSEELFRAE